MSEIDARDFGALEAKVEALASQIQALSAEVKELLALANKSKGGFWMGMAIASFVGGAFTFIANTFFHK
jgi:hypothetical protein